MPAGRLKLSTYHGYHADLLPDVGAEPSESLLTKTALEAVIAGTDPQSPEPIGYVIDLPEGFINQNLDNHLVYFF